MVQHRTPLKCMLQHSHDQHLFLEEGVLCGATGWSSKAQWRKESGQEPFPSQNQFAHSTFAASLDKKWAERVCCYVSSQHSSILETPLWNSWTYLINAPMQLKQGISPPWDFNLNLLISRGSARMWVPFPKPTVTRFA